MHLVKTVLSLFFILVCLLTVFNSVNAADFTVNKDTSLQNINSWIKDNSTLKGDNLIFNTSSYNLGDTLIITKSINIKSDIKTQINYNGNREMFNIATEQVNFSGLILNHNGVGSSTKYVNCIYSGSPYKLINIDSTIINLNNDYAIAISISEWKGNLNNSIINGKGNYNFGIVSSRWDGSVFNSSISLNKKNSIGISIGITWKGNFENSKIHTKGVKSGGILSNYWIGNSINSFIINGASNSVGIYLEKWNGNIIKTNIHSNSANSKGFHAFYSKGTIHGSNIQAKKGNAIIISKNVKVSRTYAVSKKGKPKIYIFGPRLEVSKVKKKKGDYQVQIFNAGELTSKPAKILVYTRSYKRYVKIPSLGPKQSSRTKVSILNKYSNLKYTKYVLIYYKDIFGKKSISKTFKFR